MANKNDNRSGNKNRRFGGWSFYGIVLIILLAMSFLYSNNSAQMTQSYSELIEKIDQDEVEEVNIRGTTLEMRLKERNENGDIVIKQDVSPYWMTSLLEHLENARVDHGLKYNYIQPTDMNAWISTIMSVLIFVVFGFLLYTMFTRQGADGRNTMNFGKSRAKMFETGDNDTTFKDVAGADEEKAELEEVVDFLKNPDKYSRLGARIPRGILLVGPPGTGKTLLAKAVAGEANVPFYSISGSDFVEMFVGVGASRVRDLFETAKKNSPSIIFIDEIDAVGRQRGAGLGGGHDEREQTLNQLLVEMDGFGPKENVIVMAATNRPDILDSALLRAGRFDRRVVVNRPDIVGREAILEVHARNKPLDSSVDLGEIAKITPGFTGADLANLLNEAALLAARRNAPTILYNDVSEAVFKVMIGPEKKSRVINEKERYLTAFHEAGHALILRAVSQTDRVERVSIIPAGQAGGYTAHKPFEDTYYATKQQLIDKIAIALGGRGAEQVVLGEISTGAASDLQQCNKIARDMVVKYGMSERLGNLTFNGDDDEVFLGRDYGHVKNYSNELASVIDEEVKVIIDGAYNHVLHLLKTRRPALDAIANALMEKEKIDGDEFEAIYVANTTAEQRAADPDNPARNDRNKPQAHSRQPGVDFSPEPPEYDNAEQGEGM
ncbi:MAG: ATP-dependent zinc metalloprotease FtsH [Fastidiosipilaceae bacterium]|jgi:cell division protease FtsH